MLDRSRALRTALLALVATLALASPSVAAADDDTIPVPADAPTVLGPDAAGTTVIAFVHGKDLCLAAQEAGAHRPRTVPAPGGSGFEAVGGCQELPVLVPFGHEDVATASFFTSGVTAVALGVTGADAASVELRDGAKVVGRAPTAPLPLPGAAADLRVYAVALPGETNGDFTEVAVRDAAGAVRFVDDRSFPDDRLGRVLRRGGTGERRWTLRVATRHVLEDTPLEPDRHVRETCAVLRIGQFEESSPCDRAGPAEDLTAEPTAGCAPEGSGAVVLARPAVRRVVALMGDGRRVAVPLTRLPGATAGTRVGVVFAGVDVVLRRLIGLDAAGHEVDRFDLGLAPVARTKDCGSGGGFFTTSPDLPKVGAGPHVARLADAGASLCVAVDRAPRVPDDCSVPPLDPVRGYVSAYPTAEGAHLVGVAPPDVTAARLTFDDGTKTTVAATPASGYTGRYAGVLRLIETDVPAPRRAVRQELLDARGRVLDESSGPQKPPLADVATLGRVAGVTAPLRAGSLRSSSRTAVGLCATLGALAEIDDCFVSSSGSRPTARLWVDCATHRTLVVALLPRASDRLLVPTSTGRTVTPRVFPLPGRLRGAGGARVAAVSLSPREGVSALLFRGAHPRRDRLSLPPGARQCGYSLSSYAQAVFPF